MSQIIVVDDDAANAMLIQMLLEMDGYATVACQTAKEAEEAIKPETEVFIVDVNLARGLSGIDLLQRIRSGQTNAPLDAIVIMTSGDQRRETDCYSAGANSFLLKPYAPNKLSEHIKELLT
jgi:CheY-like chemotaxis protein